MKAQPSLKDQQADESEAVQKKKEQNDDTPKKVKVKGNDQAFQSFIERNIP